MNACSYNGGAYTVVVHSHARHLQVFRTEHVMRAEHGDVSLSVLLMVVLAVYIQQ